MNEQNPAVSSMTMLTTDGEQWYVRGYLDGKYRAVQVNGPGLSPVFDREHKAATWVRLTDEARERMTR